MTDQQAAVIEAAKAYWKYEAEDAKQGTTGCMQCDYGWGDFDTEPCGNSDIDSAVGSTCHLFRLGKALKALADSESRQITHVCQACLAEHTCEKAKPDKSKKVCDLCKGHNYVYKAPTDDTKVICPKCVDMKATNRAKAQRGKG